MMGHRLLTVLLVLLQAGLAARAHEHSEDADLGRGHSAAPHAHAHDLFNLLLPHLLEDDDDADADHDADAVYLTAPASGVASAGAAAHGLVPAPVDVTASMVVNDPLPFLLGLPPSTAGPTRPLYLTHCALRN